MCVQEMDEGIKVSKLGNCVVEDDGSGVWVRPARMTTRQMQVELDAAAIPWPESGKRKDFTTAVKVCGDTSAVFNVVDDH
jgi:hypothetical protein